MSLRAELMKAAQIASAVYRSSGAKDRVEHEGYIRVDPLAIAASEGLFVMLRPMQSLLGAFLRMERPGIMVNSDRPPGLIHMSCAHELGHYFLGHGTTGDETMEYDRSSGRIEQEADWFAYQLLMPRALLSHVMQLKGWTAASLRDPLIVYQLSLRLGMSFTATVWSLCRQQVLPVDRANALAKIAPKEIKEDLIGRAVSERTQDVWLLDKSDRDLVLEPRVTDRFVVDLPNHATAGFLWTLDEAESAGFRLRPITVDADHNRLPDPMDLKFGGDELLRYSIDRLGDAPIQDVPMQFNFAEGQLFAKGSPDHDQFHTSALFERVEVGLSPQSKALLVEEVGSQ